MFSHESKKKVHWIVAAGGGLCAAAVGESRLSPAE